MTRAPVLALAGALVACGGPPAVERIVDGHLVVGPATDEDRFAAALLAPPPAPAAIDPGAGLPLERAEIARLLVAARREASGEEKLAAARHAGGSAAAPRLWGAAIAAAPRAREEAVAAVLARRDAGDLLGAAAIAGAVADALASLRNLAPGPLPEAVALLAVDDALLAAPERLAARRRKALVPPEELAARAIFLGAEGEGMTILRDRAQAGSVTAAALLDAFEGRPSGPAPAPSPTATRGGRALLALARARRLGPLPTAADREDALALGGLAGPVGAARIAALLAASK